MVHLYKQDGETVYGVKEYIVDVPADISNLPTNVPKIKVGSTALVISTGDRYILNGNGEWKIFPKTQTGSGDSGSNADMGVLIEF